MSFVLYSDTTLFKGEGSLVSFYCAVLPMSEHVGGVHLCDYVGLLLLAKLYAL